jgi:hypothetical protein
LGTTLPSIRFSDPIVNVWEQQLNVMGQAAQAFGASILPTDYEVKILVADAIEDYLNSTLTDLEQWVNWNVEWAKDIWITGALSFIPDLNSVLFADD